MTRPVILACAVALLAAEAAAEVRIRLVARVAPICAVERVEIVPRAGAARWTVDLSCNLPRYVLGLPGARAIRAVEGAGVRGEVLADGRGIRVTSLRPGAQRLTFLAEPGAGAGAAAPRVLSLVTD